MKLFIFLIITILVIWSGYAQEKVFLKSADYDSWQRLSSVKVSPDGQTYSYGLYSDNKADTLYVSQFKKPAKRHKIINGKDLLFLNNKLLVYLDEKKTAHLENTSGVKIKEYLNIKHFESALNGRFLILYSHHLSVDNPGSIIILDSKYLTEKHYSNIIEIARSKDDRRIVLSKNLHSEGQLHLIELASQKDRLLLSTMNTFFNLISWSEDGKGLAFIKTNKESSSSSIGFLNCEKINSKPKILRSLNNMNYNYRILTDNMSSPSISPNGEKIFFWIEKVPCFRDSINDNVEIWNAPDKYSYPIKKYFPPLKPDRKFAEWNMENNSVRKITLENELNSYLSPNGRYVLSTSNNKYFPIYKYKGTFSDIYIKDLSNHETFLLLEKYRDDFQQSVQFSPSGDRLVYFKENQWWIFDLNSKEKNVLTEKNLSSFDYNLYPDAPLLYDFNIWSDDGKYILVADQYDIWLIKTDGSGLQKLTSGRVKNKSYRLAVNPYPQNFEHLPFTIDLKEGIYLEAKNRNTDERGYYVWNFSKGLQKIVYKPKHISQLVEIPNDNGYLYIQEDFNNPPELVYQSGIKNSEHVLGRSNLQQDKFYWGRSEMIYYRSVNNEPLRAALFYPANYKKGTKYPMIFSIYEDKTQDLHKYYYPNIYDGGLNTALYTLNGYFVLQPQITYNRGNPGISAYEDIDAALDFIENQGMIDMDRIGLYGHSFGGYEASFIATQSDRFAAIVAGSPFTDIVSNYFSYSSLLGGPQFFRTEYNQPKMNKDFFEIKDQYLANSPVHQADNIHTPLLLWHGKEDDNVSWLQSLELYFAITRQEKEVSLLVYPDEGHVLTKKENIKDLNNKLLDWYNYYLKGYPLTAWME